MKKIFTLVLTLVFLLATSACDSLPIDIDNTTTASGGETVNKKLELGSTTGDTPELKITFIQTETPDGVEQDGDSYLIQCGSVDILVDAGEKGSGTGSVVPVLKEKVTDKTLDLVIITHNDSDHIGGMVGLSNKEGALSISGFTYLNILDSGIKSTTTLYGQYETIKDNLVASGTKYYRLQDCFDADKPNTPNVFYLAKDTYFEVFDTKSYEYYTSTVNDQSVSGILIHKQKSFVLCGDAEEWLEKKIAPVLEAKMKSLNITNIDLFKLNHHGSTTSNTNAFLDIVKPLNAVVLSSYASSQHNNPELEVVDRVNTYTDNLYAVFIDGDITVTSDGSKLTFKAEDGGAVSKLQSTSWYSDKKARES